MGKKGRKNDKKLSKEEMAFFREVLQEIASTEESRFLQCKDFIQHGRTTVRRHCIRVAHTAYYMAKRLKLKVNERELIRGALLHDYFLYDWHEKSLKNSIHGYTHPKAAMNEAKKDFNLSDREKNMILRHMFPLTPLPPKYKEGWLLCIADKICATKETLKRKNVKRNNNDNSGDSNQI